jgi:hypothetical protein
MPWKQCSNTQCPLECRALFHWLPSRFASMTCSRRWLRVWQRLTRLRVEPQLSRGCPRWGGGGQTVAAPSQPWSALERQQRAVLLNQLSCCRADPVRHAGRRGASAGHRASAQLGSHGGRDALRRQRCRQPRRQQPLCERPPRIGPTRRHGYHNGLWRQQRVWVRLSALVRGGERMNRIHLVRFGLQNRGH